MKIYDVGQYLGKIKRHMNEEVRIPVPQVGRFRVHPTKTYQPMEFSKDEVQNFLSQLDRGQGIFGYELFMSSERKLLHFFNHAEIENSSFTNEVNPLHCLSTADSFLHTMSAYYIESNRPSCFPFKMNQEFSILNSIQDLVESTLVDEHVYIQFLFNKMDTEKWKEEVDKVYQSYLKGINNPSSSKLIRSSIQERALKWVSKTNLNIENAEIKAYDDKMNQDGYNVCIRIAIFGGNKTKHERIAKLVEKAFRPMKDYNSFSLSSVFMMKRNFVENFILRRMPFIKGKYQVLAEEEIYPLIVINEFNMEEDIEPSYDEVVTVQEQESVGDPSITRLWKGLPSFGLMPMGKGNVNVSIKIQEAKLNKLLRRLGILKEEDVKVISSQNLATVQKVNVKFPNGAKISQIENEVRNIQTGLGLKSLSVQQGQGENVISFTTPQDKRPPIFLRDHLSSEKFIKFAKENDLPFIVGVGVNNDGEPIYECLTKMPHLLVAGATNSGKSVFINCLLFTLLLTKTPQELTMYCIDPKMVELTEYRRFPHVKSVITEADKAKDVLNQIVQEMERRYELMSKKGYKKISQYNKKEAEKLNYIVVVIDEFAELVMQVGDEVKDALIRLAQKARAAGIHLILATQKPVSTVVDTLLKSNLPSRVCFSFSSGTDYRTVLDRKPPYRLMGRGDGTCMLIGRQGDDDYGFIRFQGLLIADEETEEKLFEDISEQWKQILDGKEIPDDLPPLPPKEEELEPIDKLKQIIMETKETRIRGYLDAEMKMRTCDVQDLMKQLVDEGFLIQTTNFKERYKLNPDYTTEEVS